MADLVKDEWVDVAPAPAANDNADSGWIDVPPAAAEPATIPAEPGIMSALDEGAAALAEGRPDPYLSSIAHAFVRGAKEGFGPDKVGLSDESVKFLSQSGIFEREGAPGFESPIKTFNETVLIPAAAALDMTARGASGLFRGAQAAVYTALGEGPLARDVAALPEAFFGSPHPLGIPKTLPELPERPLLHAEAPAIVADTIAAAQDLGVVGKERPPITEGTPVEAARAAVEPPPAMAAQRPPDPTVKSAVEGTATDKAGNIRLDLIDKPEDVLNVIRSAAEEAGGKDAFMPARHGDIPLAQVDALSQVTGIAPEEMDIRGMGRLMKNDNEVRVAIQAMIQSAEDTAAAMKKAALTDAPEDLIEFQRLRMRHSVLQEQVAGLTAEWGRTGNVFQEFGDGVKDAKSLGQFLKDKKGESIDDLRNMVKAGSQLDPRTQLPKFMNDSRKPGFWDKALFYWVNALISGPITHLKYIGANAAFGAYEAAVVTPLAATIGKVRESLGFEAADKVLYGEAAARMWGLVAGAPDALVAAYKAGKTGLQTPLPGELAQGIIPKQNKNIFFQQKPIEGTLGLVIGAPSHGASAIHSFFNFLGYRASLEQQAYRAAAKEGLTPTDDAFWQRRGELAANPTKEMMDRSIEEGYRLTFINELSPGMKKVSQAINALPGARLIMPFVHIPFNILKAATDNTALSVFSKEAREDIAGKNGVAAQDTAIARVVAGSAMGAWMMNLAVNDRATGFGPTDPKERAQWLATGHQPYSIRIGDFWVSYNRFGPVGTLLGLHANFADALPHMKWDGEEATKATAMLVHATGRLMMDEVGMQGLAGIIEAINEPERKGARFVSNFTGSWLPYSSMLRQTASFIDPDMREAKTFIDGLRQYIPLERENLYPKRDWTGTPIANPGYHSILRTGVVSNDPIALEMKALDLHPAPPHDRIHGVKLPQDLYDKYQSTAGPLTRLTLERLVESPGWADLPPYVREQAFKKTIETTRQMAAAAMQVTYPQLIQQAIEDKVNHLTGAKKTKLKDPESPPNLAQQ